MPNYFIFLLLSTSATVKASGFHLASPAAANGRSAKEMQCLNASGQTEDGPYIAAQAYLAGEPLKLIFFVFCHEDSKLKYVVRHIGNP